MARTIPSCVTADERVFMISLIEVKLLDLVSTLMFLPRNQIVRGRGTGHVWHACFGSCRHLQPQEREREAELVAK
jgi:hypothetical protein